MEIKELKFEELTVEQKLGMAMVGHIYNRWNDELFEENTQYAINMIKEHKLGAIWVDGYKREEVMARIKEVADYPILIMTDSECGFVDERTPNIGYHNAIGTCNTEKSAYAFGKVTAVNARNAGYNVVCDPVLDMTKSNATCGTTVRCIGGNKHRVTELAIAEAQGMHDGGVLTVGKHFPSAPGNPMIDSHMAENCSDVTYEELVDYYLYPYLELSKRGLLDGIMTAHCRLTNIDPEYPASLSKKVIGLFRDLGFNGFAVTDALVMMGTAAKFGRDGSRGLAIAGGNDLALTWTVNKDCYESLLKCYNEGIIPDDMLDAAVKRVLETQHKITLLDTTAEITDEDIENFNKINTDGVFAKTDEGVSTELCKDGKHFFIILSPNGAIKNGEINVDTMAKNWYNPHLISERIKESYPNSAVKIISEFPGSGDGYYICEKNVDYDDIVFVTFTECLAYVGCENFAPRLISLFEALQITNRISTLVHFGNPFVLEDLPHIGRVIIGGASATSVNATLDVLEGKYPAKGSLTYDIKFR